MFPPIHPKTAGLFAIAVGLLLAVPAAASLPEGDGNDRAGLLGLLGQSGIAASIDRAVGQDWSAASERLLEEPAGATPLPGARTRQTAEPSNAARPDPLARTGEGRRAELDAHHSRNKIELPSLQADTSDTLSRRLRRCAAGETTQVEVTLDFDRTGELRGIVFSNPEQTHSELGRCVAGAVSRTYRTQPDMAGKQAVLALRFE